MMNNTISIMIVDDHILVRKTIRDRLELEEDMTVVADESSADDAVREAVLLKPDVVLMDIDMPGQLAFGAIRIIKSRSQETKVIILSAFCQDHYIDQALEAEASGYITKNEPPDSLIQAIRMVASGDVYFSPEIQSRIVVDTKEVRLPQKGCSRTSTLTEREKEVLFHISRGLAKKEIAPLMNISIKTVEQHTTNLMTKLCIHDRVQLTRFAIREGMAEA